MKEFVWEIFEIRGKIEKRIPMVLHKFLESLRQEVGVESVSLFVKTDDSTLRLEFEASEGEGIKESVIRYRAGELSKVLREKFGLYFKIPLVFGELLGFVVLWKFKDYEEGRKLVKERLCELIRELSILMWMFNALMEARKVEIQLKNFEKMRSFEIERNLEELRSYFSADFVAVKTFDNKVIKSGEGLSDRELVKLLSVSEERLREGILNYSDYFNSQMIYRSADGNYYFVGSKRSYAFSHSDLLMLKLFASQFDKMKALRETLEKYNTYLRVVFENLRDGIAVVDGDARVVVLNSAAKKIIKSEVLNIANPLWEYYQRAITEKIFMEIQNFEWADRFYDITLQPVRFEDQDAVIILMRDRTFEVKMKGRMKRLEKLSVLGEFAVGIAHEIRNPLSGIKMLVQVLPSVKDNEEEFENTVKLIDDEVNRLAKIVDQINSFAKPAVVNKTLVDAKEFVLPVIKMMEKKIRDKEVKVEVDVKGEVVVDSEKMKQVVFNLLDNALDAVGKGGYVKIKGERKGDYFVLVVEDNGKGMSVEEMGKVFDPFFTKKENGVGLGLSISSRIVDEHGGWIEVESEVGKGSKFAVILPVGG